MFDDIKQLSASDPNALASVRKMEAALGISLQYDDDGLLTGAGALILTRDPQNGLLTGIRKLAWPKLKQHYGERLEQLYTDLDASQADELHALRQSGADAPVLQTVIWPSGSASTSACRWDRQRSAHSQTARLT